MKTPSAFLRQLDDLRGLSRAELPDTPQLQLLRERIQRARNESGVSAGYSQDDVVDRSALRFLRVLAAAEHELSGAEVDVLESTFGGVSSRCSDRPHPVTLGVTSG